MLAPTRRVYLVLLFGVGGVVAVIVVLVAVFLVLDDVHARVGWAPRPCATCGYRSVMLVATGTVSGYHWMVQREDRAMAPVRQPRSAPGASCSSGHVTTPSRPRSHRVTGARVEGWPAEGLRGTPRPCSSAWRPSTPAPVLVLSGPGGLRVVGSYRPTPASAATGQVGTASRARPGSTSMPSPAPRASQR